MAQSLKLPFRQNRLFLKNLQRHFMLCATPLQTVFMSQTKTIERGAFIKTLCVHIYVIRIREHAAHYRHTFITKSHLYNVQTPHIERAYEAAGATHYSTKLSGHPFRKSPQDFLLPCEKSLAGRQTVAGV